MKKLSLAESFDKYIKFWNKVFPTFNFRWLLISGTIVIQGALWSFVMVMLYNSSLNRNNLILILEMIPPMLVTTLFSSLVSYYFVRKRMDKLLSAIQQVADGDLDVCIDTGDSGEYEVIYENFNRMVKELKDTKEGMQAFTNEFTHEFKTPITSISGFAQYLIRTGEGIETPERLEYLQVISDESLRLAELSTNTLLLSKVEACQIITDKTHFSLDEQLRHCVILLLPQLEKKNIETNLEIPEITFYGNVELLEQVWINLLSNALKFTPDHGEISISASCDEKDIFVSITDSGIGMDEETISHIFEKYYQSETLQSVQGNGIGLSIVHRIVTLCDGDITVTSEPGVGSTFTVHLPNKSY